MKKTQRNAMVICWSVTRRPIIHSGPVFSEGVYLPPPCPPPPAPQVCTAFPSPYQKGHSLLDGRLSHFWHWEDYSSYVFSVAFASIVLTPAPPAPPPSVAPRSPGCRTPGWWPQPLGRENNTDELRVRTCVFGFWVCMFVIMGVF